MRIRQCSQTWIPSIALAILFIVTIACGTSSNVPAPTFDPNLLQTAVAGTFAVSQIQTLTAGVPIDAQVSNTPESTNTPELTNTPASTDTPLSPPTQNVGVVGERRESAGIALTVLGVSKAESIDFFTPDAGNVFLIIEVLIENVSRDEETPYNPFYFSVKDSDGFQASTSFAAPDPALQSGDLPKGDKARGFVAFEVRSTASGFIVTYEPLVLFGGYEPIRISLGQ